MKRVECMFNCQSSDRRDDDENHSVRLDAVTGDRPEHENYWKWTPAGSLELQLVNANTAAFFVPGREYRITIEPVES